MVAGRNFHLTVFQANPLPVPFGKGRQNLFNSQIASLFDDQIEGFFVKLCKFFVLGQFPDIELFIEDKINVPSIGNYLCHNVCLPLL